MIVHRQARAVLEALAAREELPLRDLTPSDARDRSDRALAERKVPKQDVAAVNDCVIRGPAGDLPLRFYRPHTAQGRPVIMFLHGGGWVLGSVEDTDAACRALANASACVVVSVGYRLAPEHPFPAGPSDAYAAAVWCAENGRQAGGDGGPIAVCGASAGGNIAATVTRWARDRGGPPVGFQGLVCPVTDLTRGLPSHQSYGLGYGLDSEDITWFIDHYVPTGLDLRQPDLSPLHAADLRGLPPTHVQTAEYDPLRDEGEEYAERLRQAGVPVTCTRYAGQIHGFFSSLDLYDASAEAIDELGGAVRGALG